MNAIAGGKCTRAPLAGLGMRDVRDRVGHFAVSHSRIRPVQALGDRC